MTLPISLGGCLEGRIGASVSRIESGKEAVPIPIGEPGYLSLLQDLTGLPHNSRDGELADGLPQRGCRLFDGLLEFIRKTHIDPGIGFRGGHSLSLVRLYVAL